MKVTYHAWGNTERQSSGYDYFAVERPSIFGVGASIESTEEHMGCAMGDHDDSAEEILEPGTYSFTFTASTNDGRWHVGMVHHGSISWTPA
jgi:hypothetical protein